MKVKMKVRNPPPLHSGLTGASGGAFRGPTSATQDTNFEKKGSFWKWHITSMVISVMQYIEGFKVNKCPSDIYISDISDIYYKYSSEEFPELQKYFAVQVKMVLSLHIFKSNEQSSNIIHKSPRWKQTD